MMLTALSCLSLLLYCAFVDGAAYPQGTSNKVGNQAGQTVSTTVASDTSDAIDNTNQIAVSGGGGGGSGSGGPASTSYNKNTDQQNNYQNTQTGEQSVTQTNQGTGTDTATGTSTIRQSGASTAADFSQMKGLNVTDDQFTQLVAAMNENNGFGSS